MRVSSMAEEFRLELVSFDGRAEAALVMDMLPPVKGCRITKKGSSEVHQCWYPTTPGEGPASHTGTLDAVLTWAWARHKEARGLDLD